MNEIAQHYKSFYEIILANSFDVTAIVDQEGIIKFKSPAIKKIFGYDPEEMIGRKSSDFIHPDDFFKMGEAMERLLSGKTEQLNVECRYLHKDGTYRNVEANVVNELDNPHIAGLVLNYRDITDKRRLLNEMQKQQRHLDLALKGSGLGVWDWDLQTGEIRYNARWAEMLGYELSEIAQEEGFWEKHIHEDDFERVTRALKAHINDEIAHYEEEYRLKTKEGGFRWILDRGKVMERNALGQPVRVAGTHLDITEKKRTEQHLHQKSQELLTSNKELEEFTYVTSHNLRSPAINLKALLSYFNEGSISNRADKEMWTKIRKSADQLLEVIEDLSQIVALKTDLKAQSQEVSFQEVCDKLRFALEDDIKNSGAEIKTGFEQVPRINYPVRHIESFLLNLITNSIKYRKNDRTLLITINTRKESGYTILEYQDNGRGLDMDKYGDRLFKRHQRFHENTPGDGLGLYIVKKQLDSLNGKIEADSTPGSGMNFKLHLKDQQIN